MKTVAVDFDGVIHAYSRGWQDGSIYDEPLPGAFEAIRALMDQGIAVFVHTTRDPYQVEQWIDEKSAEPDRAGRISCLIDNGEGHAEFWNEVGALLITRRKYPAIVYIDDRGLRFESWEQALEDLEDLEGITVR